MRAGYATDDNKTLCIDFSAVAMMAHDGDKVIITFKGNAVAFTFPGQSGKNILAGFIKWVEEN